jgi:TolB-like protein/tetratricopeptide (TPR) repeat protein
VDPVSLFGEFKRRRVFRALVGYGIAAFAVLQIIEPVMHGLHWSEAVLSYAVVALAIGFPVVVGLAWIFDVGSAGIERTAPAARLRGPRLALVLVGIGVLAAAPGTIWYFVVRGIARSAPQLVATGNALPSIAVLPFVNLSSDKEQEYFSDGMAEEILNALVQVDGLRVIGRTSSFYFKGRNDDLRTIGKKLGASNLLEGSVRRAGSRIRITAQLVEARGGSHLWSQAFDRDLTDVFVVQEEIARAVVTALKVKLLPAEAPTAKDRRTVNPDAYSRYLLGRHAMNQANPDGWRRAVKAFEEALSLDPGYAPAWAGLAQAKAQVVGNIGGTRTEVVQAHTSALSAAEKAVALAPDLADGYLARARVRTDIKHDWTGAAADLERALALNPSDPRAFRSYAYSVLVPLGRIPEAISAARKATELDPVSAYSWALLGFTLCFNGEMDAARSALIRAGEFAPDFQWPAFWLAAVDLLEGQPAKALARYEQVSTRWTRLTGAAMAQHDLGHARESQAALEELIREDADDAPYQIAEVYARRRELDHAFDWLERAYALPDVGLIHVKPDPLLRNLHGDPRYTALLKKMNLPVD